MAGTATLSTDRNKAIFPGASCPSGSVFRAPTDTTQPHPALEFHSLEHAETWWVCCPESCSTARHLSKLAKPRTKPGVGSRQEGDLESRKLRRASDILCRARAASSRLPSETDPARHQGWHFTGQK